MLHFSNSIHSMSVCLCVCVCSSGSLPRTFPSTFPLTLTDQVFCSCFFYLFERDTSKSISLHHHVSNCFRSVLDVLPIGTHHHHPSDLGRFIFHLSQFIDSEVYWKSFSIKIETHTHTQVLGYTIREC